MRRNTVIFIIITLLGLGILAAGGTSYWQRHQAQHWHAVAGQIVSSQLGQCRGRSTGYFPDITYRYTVAGKTYQAQTIRFGPRLMSQEDSENLVLANPQGRKILVYVNPRAPEQAILDRDNLSSDLRYQWIVGIVFTLAGGFLTLIMRQLHR